MTQSDLLVHSALVGPASWAPVAAELSRRGHAVAVPDLGGDESSDAAAVTDALVALADGMTRTVPT